MLKNLQKHLTPCALRKAATFDNFRRCLAFAAAGSTSAYCVPTIVMELTYPMGKQKERGYPEDSFWGGSRLYKIYFMIVSVPFYGWSLLFYGTLVGQRQFFVNFVLRMWSRVIA